MRAHWAPVAALAAALGIGGAGACTSPTVTLATREPIEIRIDLHHEVRVQIDREVSGLLGDEAQRDAITPRSERPSDGEIVRTAKARGVIGERSDGYLGVHSVEAAGEDTQALVERVNQQRAEEYGALAQSFEVERTEVEKLAGAQRIGGASPEELVRAPDGEWIRAEEADLVVVEGGESDE